MACAIGIAVPLVVGSTWRDRLHGLLAVVPCAAVGMGAFLVGGELVDWGFR